MGATTQTPESEGESQPDRAGISVGISAGVDLSGGPSADDYRLLVLREYAKVAFADIRKTAKWGSRRPTALLLEDGVKVDICQDGLAQNEIALIPSSELDDSTAAAIAEIIDNGNGGLRVKMHDKVAALRDMARILRMMEDGISTGPKRDQITGGFTPKVP